MLHAVTTPSSCWSTNGPNANYFYIFSIQHVNQTPLELLEGGLLSVLIEQG